MVARWVEPRAGADHSDRTRLQHGTQGLVRGHSALSAVAQGQAFLEALPAPVAPDLPHAVVGRDGAHPAAGVRGRRGLVEAPDGGSVICVAGGRTHVEELLGRELAVEDVATDEPDI